MRLVHLAVFVMLAGCLQGAEPVVEHPVPTTTWPVAFDEPVTVMDGEPSSTIGAAGEPNLVIASDGTRYVGVLGCMEGQSLGAAEAASCRHGLIYRSLDGIDWTLLNQGDDRQLGDGPYANGDTTVAVADGVVHVVLLQASDMHYHRSVDGGDTWAYMGTIGQGDRPWLVSAPDGRLLASWIEGRQIVVGVSADGGDTWDVGTVDATAARQGRVVWGPACTCFLMPIYVQTSGGGILSGDTELVHVSIQVLRSQDGIDWEPAGEFEPYPIGLNGMLTHDYSFGMPAVAQSEDGLTGVAWSTGVGPEPGVRTAARMYLAIGQNASDWGPVEDVTPEQSAVLPALAGGDELVLAYYSSPLPGDPERVGVWSMSAHFLHRDQRVVVENDVHVGGVCGRGGFCPAAAADRSLFDFFEASPLPDGRVALAYTADPVDEGKSIRIRYAEQSV